MKQNKVPCSISMQALPEQEPSLLPVEKNISENIMRPSASFASLGDIRGKHQPSLSSLELSSMLASWVDSKKCTEYDHEVLCSSGINFQAVALKQRLSEDDQRSNERDQQERSTSSASKGSYLRCPRYTAVSSEHVEDLLEPASDVSQNRRASKRSLDPVDTFCKLPRYITR
jgi:hypothetical protein